MENKFIIGGAVVVGVCALPIVIGFGTGGVVGGSIAAGIQSGIGCVQAGSLFATTQTFVMGGAAVKGIITGAAAAGTGTAKKAFSYFWNRGQKEEEKKDDKTGSDDKDHVTIENEEDSILKADQVIQENNLEPLDEKSETPQDTAERKVDVNEELKNTDKAEEEVLIPDQIEHIKEEEIEPISMIEQEIPKQDDIPLIEPKKEDIPGNKESDQDSKSENEQKGGGYLEYITAKGSGIKNFFSSKLNKN